jgi:homoserine O-succinyltransferase/O-acetyltransferase
MRIAILDMYANHANEGMRCIWHAIQAVEQAKGVSFTVDVFNVRAENHVPDLSYDAYISTGGPGSPLPSTEAWEAPYFAFIDALFAHNRSIPPLSSFRGEGLGMKSKHLFLICHSFQLVSRHFGLGTLSKRKSTSFGIFPIHRTDDGMGEPLFAGLPEPFFAVDSRDYQLTEPSPSAFDAMGAKLLALEKIRPHIDLERAIMAIRFSDTVFGTQFHPEADDEGMLRYFLQEEKRQQIVTNYSQVKYDEMVAYLRDPQKIALTESVILPGFLKQALAATMKGELASV